MQYDNCNCNAVPEGCEPKQRIVSECSSRVPGELVIVVPVNTASTSFYDYIPGAYFLVGKESNIL